ncbi:cytochrome P460 family protein [Geomonas sp. Red69]|uniref:cytochrome P460 family protein n=1 Tax=Geomonas diazotrophica TaxID=2843197 RepID=UPI001C0F677B|nr:MULTISPECIES: cytochrome P460 family protein [Geomonas]MBU5637002.1 cytochrome P460 family protein [Geomonas diazotrophica]QXE88045.1 cytochrome P460 family protein [Geomonas nitrogeniifigens]
MKKTLSILTLAALLSAVGAACAADQGSLPRNYESWEKSKARVITDKKSMFYGIHYIYVNKKAMPTYKTGGANYPDGSRFVAVNYSIKEEGGKQVPGKKTMIVMMQRDKKQQETGGWRFVGFTPDGKPSGLDGKRDCFGCHEKDAKDRGFVLSRYPDFK